MAFDRQCCAAAAAKTKGYIGDDHSGAHPDEEAVAGAGDAAIVLPPHLLGQEVPLPAARAPALRLPVRLPV